MQRATQRKQMNNRRSRPEPTTSTPPQQPPQAETRVAQHPLNPQLLALFDKLHDEVEETSKISDLSQNLASYLRQLGTSIETASDSAEAAGHVMQNWERTFSIMGEMNKGREKESQTWVRLKDNENGR